jgi:CMP-N,N'-diacetyllegionaminic acid synthase
MINNKKVLAVTLARGGSKSVKNKNIKLLAGKPLIAYTVDAANASAYIDDYIVSTDDTDIESVCQSLNVNVPFRRPKHLATDSATSGDALFHAVESMEKINGFKYDYVIELMATNPFKTSRQIDDAIEMLHNNSADSVIAVTRVYDQHPARIKKLDEAGRLENFCVDEPLEARRQDLTPAAYIRCGSIYAISRDFLMATKSRYGSKESYALIIPEDESVNIDNAHDFALAELLIENEDFSG